MLPDSKSGLVIFNFNCTVLYKLFFFYQEREWGKSERADKQKKSAAFV